MLIGFKATKLRIQKIEVSRALAVLQKDQIAQVSSDISINGFMIAE
jgi:hypothetical protein